VIQPTEVLIDNVMQLTQISHHLTVGVKYFKL